MAIISKRPLFLDAYHFYVIQIQNPFGNMIFPISPCLLPSINAEMTPSFWYLIIFALSFHYQLLYFIIVSLFQSKSFPFRSVTLTCPKE